MKTRRAVVGMAGSAIIAAALAGCGGSDTPRATNPGGTATPGASSPASPFPSPTLEPAVDGALPVPAYPASSIPWDDVGDGWFLLTVDLDAGDDVWPQTDGIGRFPTLDESVMLVSPTGDLYYVRSLVGVGNGWPIEWLGDALTILDGSFAAESEDVPEGPLLSLDLATGAATVVNPSAYDPFYLRTLPDGRIVTQWGVEGSLSVEVLAPDLTPLASLCAGNGIATSLSPDGTSVVCLESEGDTGATVTLHDISGGAGTPLDTFKYPAWAYGTFGWWDDTSFVLTRWTDEGDPLRWAYDVSTRKIRDLNATLSDGTPAETVQGSAGYRVVAAGAVVEIQDFDGALRATLPCLPTAISGHVALASCWSEAGPTQMVVADLDTGTVTTVASYAAGDSADIRVFPAPGGERTGLA